MRCLARNVWLSRFNTTSVVRKFVRKIIHAVGGVATGRRILLFLVVFNFVAVILLFYIFFTQKSLWWLIGKIPAKPRQVAEQILERVGELPYIRYAFASSNLPEYRLEIDKDDYAKMLKALPNNPRIFFGDEYKKIEKATFNYNDKNYDAKVRFRGDGSGHWFWAKKSWRIEFAQQNGLNGFTAINLITPSERGYITEAFNNYRARKLGLTVPDDDFVVLYVNGKKHGVYYQIEQWGKDFLERQGLSSDTNFYGDELPPQPLDPFSIFGELIDVEGKWKKFTSNPLDSKDDYSDLYYLLETLYASDDNYFIENIFNILDKDSFLSWFVHGKLMQSLHQDTMHNARLYFDKDIGKFRVLPIDVGDPDEGLNYFLVGHNPLIDRLLLQKDFLVEAQQRLWQYVSDEKNITDDLKAYDDLYSRVKVAFYQDKFDEETFGVVDNTIQTVRSRMERSFEFIKESLGQVSVASVVTKGNLRDVPATVEVSIVGYVPVALKSVVLETTNAGGVLPSFLNLYVDTNNDGVFNSGDSFLGLLDAAQEKNTFTYTSLDSGEMIYPHFIPLDRAKFENIGNMDLLALNVYEPQPVKRNYFVVSRGEALEVNSVAFTFENFVTGKKIQVKRPQYVSPDNFVGFEKKNYSIDQAALQHSMFYKDSDTTLVIRPGLHYIAKTLIVPQGLTLVVQPGTQLSFAPHASLVSYSPVIARGTLDNPIRFFSAEQSPWGVFAIVQARETSVFEYAFFENGGSARVAGAIFSGTLAAHYSDVLVKYSRFSTAQGDDALNVKYASTTIMNSIFSNNSADAIDLDYASGGILNNSFIQNGNDGIDLSGSNLLIQNNRIVKSGDKCISIGEQSKNPIIFNNILNGCKIGIETKDASTPLIMNNVIVFNDIGLNAYRKKELFINGGLPRVYNSILWHNKEQVRDDGFSKTEINFSSVIPALQIPAGLFPTW